MCIYHHNNLYVTGNARTKKKKKSASGESVRLLQYVSHARVTVYSYYNPLHSSVTQGRIMDMG